MAILSCGTLTVLPVWGPWGCVTTLDMVMSLRVEKRSCRVQLPNGGLLHQIPPFFASGFWKNNQKSPGRLEPAQLRRPGSKGRRRGEPFAAGCSRPPFSGLLEGVGGFWVAGVYLERFLELPGRVR